MQKVVGALADQQAELASLVDALDEAAWLRPSRCEGWTVGDVVLHIAQTDELAVASATGRLAGAIARPTDGAPGSDVDEGADRMVARERGQPGAVIRERWATGAEALCRALLDCEPAKRVMWVAGDLSARTLATTRLAETWIHTGDIAFAFDRALEPTDRLWHIARLAWRTVPYAFARAGRTLAGPVAFDLASPTGGRWQFVPDATPLTTIRGDALELCTVAGRRAEPASTSLEGEGPDADAVLDLVRTYA